MSKSVQTVIGEMNMILKAALTDCIAALKPLALLDRPENMAYACLELYHTQRYELVYNAFFVEDGELEIDYAYHPDFNGDRSFLPTLADYIQKTIGEIEWTQAQGQEFVEQHEMQFLSWMKEAWVAAGGHQSKIPTYFCFEKEDRVQDIMTGEVMDEDEAARRLGFQVDPD